MADSTDRITPATTKRDAPVDVPATGPGPERGEVAPRPVHGNGRPDGPEAMRREIARTRARLSRTLDDLEDRIVAEQRALERRKEELWAKATLQGLRKKLSSEPWRSVGIAFAVGYIIAAIRD